MNCNLFSLNLSYKDCFYSDEVLNRNMHIRTEERILFPKIEEVIGEEELNILNGQIIAVKESCGI